MENGIILFTLPAARIPAAAFERVHAAGGGREVVVTSDPAEIESLIDRIEIGIGDFPFALIPRAANLAWIQLWSAGADWLQKHPEVKPLPFMLTTTSGMHGHQMTEHLFSMILAWNRCLPRAFKAQLRHEWTKLQPKDMTSLDGKTMLILGYGSIGETAAKAARCFGMNVIGLRRNPPALENGLDQNNVRVEAASRLHEFLPDADLAVNILPATEDTKRSFGETEFSMMKNSALYINIGRGVTTDEEALIKALKAEKIAGALLDVVSQEPLPPDSPLWDMDNVIITAHSAGFRPDYDEAALEIALDNLGRYVRGEPLRNLVDKQQGY